MLLVMTRLAICAGRGAFIAVLAAFLAARPVAMLVLARMLALAAILAGCRRGRRPGKLDLRTVPQLIDAIDDDMIANRHARGYRHNVARARTEGDGVTFTLLSLPTT